LAKLIKSHDMKVCDFGKLDFKKKVVKNPDFRKIGRNEPCYCGSGKKFKKCCISKEFIETDHVDIVPRPIDLEEVAS
jgi:hypothetical protein